jgi:hypothetical protein
MSKLNITDFLDKDVNPAVLSPLVDGMQKLTGELPTAIVVTEEQWDKFFRAANERISNFRGIPLETPLASDQRSVVLKTIQGVLTGMHIAGVKDAAEVYRLLENMKIKVSGETNE